MLIIKDIFRYRGKWISLIFVLSLLIVVHCFRRLKPINSANIWLLGGYFISLLITMRIFFFIFYDLVKGAHTQDGQNLQLCQKQKENFKKEFTRGALIALSAFLFTFGICLTFPFLIIIKVPITNFLLSIFSPILALLVLLTDKNLPGVWKRLRTLDIGIFVSIFFTVLLSFLLRPVVGQDFALGFGSGAVAFNLIIANLSFDPEIYRIERMKELYYKDYKDSPVRQL